MWVPIGLGLLVVAIAGGDRAPAAPVAPGRRRARRARRARRVGALSSALGAVDRAGDGRRATAVRARGAARGRARAGPHRRSSRVARRRRSLAGIGAVAVVRAVRICFGQRAATLFLDGRLNEPLGYINGMGDASSSWASGCASRSPSGGGRCSRGSASARATLMACLACCPQSRGVALAAFVSVVARRWRSCPGSRLRRVSALLVCSRRASSLRAPRAARRLQRGTVALGRRRDGRPRRGAARGARGRVGVGRRVGAPAHAALARVRGSDRARGRLPRAARDRARGRARGDRCRAVASTAVASRTGVAEQ